MSGQLIAQIAGSLLGAGVLGAIVQGFMNRRKLGAEATDIITKAAGGIVSRLEKENTRITAALSTANRRIDELERAKDEWDVQRHELRETLTVHSAFDQEVVRRLRDLGIVDLPEPPPLLPQSMRP